MTIAPIVPDGGSGSFVEPTRAIPLSWGTYRFRMVACYLLAIAAAFVLPVAAILSGGESFAFVLIGLSMLIGCVSVFIVLPGKTKRRLIAAGATVLLVAVLSALSNAPGGIVETGNAILTPSLATAGVIVAAWFVIRQRPAATYLLVVLSIALAIGSALAAGAAMTATFTSAQEVGTGVLIYNLVTSVGPGLAIVIPVVLGRLLAGLLSARTRS